MLENIIFLPCPYRLHLFSFNCLGDMIKNVDKTVCNRLKAGGVLQEVVASVA